jgi:photosystem II stability/assembly factor-like uncharacterized protein
MPFAINSMKRITFIFAMLASLAIPPSLRAQYRWRIIQPAVVDTVSYDFSAVASYGHSCVAWGSALSTHEVIDTLFTMTSTDDGITWAKHYLPKTFDTLQPSEAIVALQMVDSLNVYAISSHWFWRSMDGGVSWTPQKLAKSDVVGFPINNLKMDFFNSKEGIVCTDDHPYYTTSDGGMTWDTGNIGYVFPSACKAYGNGKFRILSTLLYTTENYGKTTSNSYTYLIDSVAADTGFHFAFFELGGGDTIFAFCVHANPPGTWYHNFVYLSTDSGVHWTEQTMKDTAIGDRPYVATCADSGTIFVTGYPPAVVTFTTDHGSTWQSDSTTDNDPLPNGDITSIALAGSQNALAIIPAIDIDTIIVNGQSYPISGSVLARLERVPSSVTRSIPAQTFSIYPNPAAEILNIDAESEMVSILDPLGRTYSVPTTPQPPPWKGGESHWMSPRFRREFILSPMARNRLNL